MQRKRLVRMSRAFGFELDLAGDVALAGIKEGEGESNDVLASVTWLK